MRYPRGCSGLSASSFKARPTASSGLPKYIRLMALVASGGIWRSEACASHAKSDSPAAMARQINMRRYRLGMRIRLFRIFFLGDVLWAEEPRALHVHRETF